ncbi:BTB 2 domain containing protein [Pyrenophora teres f. maculata]|nr:BTB 2 domain containing protein [Pyrenophora teres f. maculata]
MQIDSSPTLPNILTLDVGGGRVFRTTKQALSAAPYFAHLFDRWEEGVKLQADGSFFLDTDPEIFEHLLRYMRRPNKFPLFWTRQAGFDYELYSRLESEADFFMLEGLRDWIRDKKYEQAVQVEIDLKEQVHFGSAPILWPGSTICRHMVVKGGLNKECLSGEHRWRCEACVRNLHCAREMKANNFPETDEDLVVSAATIFKFDMTALVNDGVP